MLHVAIGHRFPGGMALDIGFSAPAGVTVLFGPSGAGKSSALLAIAGLLRPERAEIELDGLALHRLPAEARRCGVVFQEARLFPHMTVRRNLLFGLRRAPRDATGPSPEAVIALLGLDGLLDRRPQRLSGGERQRVALGRALLSRPRLLLMDEPLASLDQPRRAEILPFLESLVATAGLPVVYVTHALEEADRLADHLVLIEAGRVVAEGPPEALSARTDLALLAARRDAGVLLRATIAGHDAQRGVTRIAVGDQTLTVPLRPEPAGTPLRLRLRARDVAVATEPPHGLAAHSVLAVRLESIAPAGPAEVFLTLRAGTVTLLARTPRHAVAALDLVPGRDLWALVRVGALDHGAG